MATLYSKRGIFYIEFRVKGKRFTRSLKLKANERNKKKALKIKKEIEVEFEHNDYISNHSIGNLMTIDNSKELTLNDAINKFKDERFGINTSKSHKKNFNIAMNYLKKVKPIQSKVLEITSTDITKIIRILEAKVSNATLHTYIRYLKMLFNYLLSLLFRKIIIPLSSISLAILLSHEHFLLCQLQTLRSTLASISGC